MNLLNTKESDLIKVLPEGRAHLTGLVRVERSQEQNNDYSYQNNFIKILNCCLFVVFIQINA